MRLRIDFLGINANTLEIHSDAKSMRAIPIAEFQVLANCKLDAALPALIDLGQRLYHLLDGPERRLASLAPNSTLELGFADPNPPVLLTHLPWELLHDGAGFLVQHGVIPVRVIGSNAAPAEPANRPLNVLFMACSPRDVQPLLDFEAEERIIMDATAKQPLYLTPEETGSVEELHETVGSYPPFDVFHLTGHGDLYNPDQHRQYVPAGQSVPAAGDPILLTEDEAGCCRLAVAGDLERAFGDRPPRLVFLSGCRTSEISGQADAAYASLAQDLLTRGFRNVMGWARPVFDTSATKAASLIYSQISSGSTIEQALRHCFRDLTRPGPNNQPFKIPDWHLLRLFTADGQSTAALVTPRNERGRAPFEKPRFDDGFVDREKKLKCAGFHRFVGRRRALQRTLPALAAESDKTGVAVWGMGGLGKSSLAARLCDRVERRRPYFRRTVLVGLLNEQRLLGVLGREYRWHRTAAAALGDGSLSLGGRLWNFFREIDGDAPLLLVMDDFEDNIELVSGAADGFRLQAAAFDTLEALGKAIHDTRTQSRLIVTTRFWSQAAFPEIDLLAEQLPGMDRAGLRKKARNEQTPEVAIEAAEGNPRLFERLAEPAGPDAATRAAIFRDELKLGELLGTLLPEERGQLARLSVFQLAVPPAMALDATGESEFHRAVSLGLAERTEASGGGEGVQLGVAALVRPLLESVLDDAAWIACYATAARSAHKLWWEAEDSPGEAQIVEIVRLATLGGERQIACDLMKNLANSWNRRNRYRDTVRWASLVLARFEDHRLLSSIAVAERVLGETSSAASHLDRARALQSEGDDRERAFALHESAVLREQQGDVHEALGLYRQSLEINDRIGDAQGKAATLHQMAGLRAQQGDVEGALELYRQSLEIKERIGNARGKAATLHQMAGLRAQQGDVEGALELYRQSLEIYERIGNAQGKAATLHNMAGLRAQQGDVEGALELYRQSLEINDRIGDAQGKAATLANMAGLAYQAGDSAKSAVYSQQAAETLAQIFAWPDLTTVLGNLSLHDSDRRIHWLTQATWLVIMLRHRSPDSILTPTALFHALPTAHPLELPLAALTLLVFTHDEPGREGAFKLLSIAAANQSMPPEVLNDWLQQQAADLGTLLRETLRSLEALAPDPWIFDRQRVIASLRTTGSANA